MKRKKFNKKDRYSRAFFLFGQCRSISRVASELDISYKEAKQLHNFYLDSQQLDDKTKGEMTVLYQKELDKLQNESDRKEAIERIKNNVLDSRRVEKGSVLLLNWFFEMEIEPMEIFFYNRSGEFLARWMRKEWEYSPFWLKFQSRFYCQRDSCFYYN